MACRAGWCARLTWWEFRWYILPITVYENDKGGNISDSALLGHSNPCTRIVGLQVNVRNLTSEPF